MENKQFDISIAATPEVVWNSLFQDATYREWTAVFAAGSRADTDWKKGSKALFVDVNNSGMVSIIEEARPPVYMSIRHLGEVKEGVEDLSPGENNPCHGGQENYILKPSGAGTELTIELAMEGLSQNMLDYFMNTWPRALDKLKEIAERPAKAIHEPQIG